jgi:peptide/nickel transport system permease protein
MSATRISIQGSAVPPSDVPLVQAPKPDAAPDALVVVARERRRSYVAPGVVADLGVLALLVAALAPTEWPGPIQIAVVLLAIALLWAGVQRIGKARFGPRFELGLWVALAWVVLIVLLALTAGILPIDGIDDPVTAERFARPALELDEPLGRDDFGRSLLSRTIHGARVSLSVGVLAAAVGMVVGGVLGLIAGYYRGRLDAVISIVANAILAFPPLILLLALVAVFARTVPNLSLGIAILAIPTFIRLTRAQTVVFSQREFVLTARAMGAKDRRIIFREILPNVLLPVASYAFLVVAVVIVAEGSLSYIGLGIPPPQPSWGGMIASAQPFLQDSPHTVFIPAAAMFFTVLSLNRVGDWARRRVSGRDMKV